LNSPAGAELDCGIVEVEFNSRFGNRELVSYTLCAESGGSQAKAVSFA
jgi:hypothetical protein